MPKFVVEAGFEGQQAINGLQQLGNEAKKLATGQIPILQSQLSRLQKLASLPDLSFRQQERLNSLLNTTKSQLDKAQNSLKQINPASNQATNALTNLGRVAQDSAFGFVGIANNLNPLVESFQRLRAETGSGKAAFSALASSIAGPGGIGLAISALTAIISFSQIGFSAWTRGFGENTAEVEKNAKAVIYTKDAYQQFSEELDRVSSSLAQEGANLSILFNALGDSNTGLSKRGKIIEQINELMPDYIGFLDKEKSSYQQISSAINTYVDDLGKSAFIKSFLPEFNKIFEKLIKAQVELRQLDLGQKGVFGLTESDYQKERQRLLTQIRLLKQDIESGKKFLTREAGGALNLYEILFGKKASTKAPNVEIEPDAIERQLGSLFPPGKVVSVPKQFSPKLVLTPSIQINRGIDSQSFTLGLFKAFLNEQALKDFQEKATTAINQTFANIINDSISTFADTIGKTLAGQGSFLPNLFEGLISSIGAQIKELGKYLVQVGVQMIIAKKAVQALKLTPQTAIIAGFALQLLGSTLAAAATKKFNSAKFATGVRNFEGGIATVGERGPETVLLPRGSSVVPNNEVMAYGGGGITLMPSIAYDGTQFRIFLNRVDAKLSRTG